MFSRSIQFLAPEFLWFLIIPSIFLVTWIWQLYKRRVAIRLYTKTRVVPVEERYPFAGELSFWLSVILALTLVIIALARPQALVHTIRSAGIDFVILQDGSTSMRVDDVLPDRWQRSTAWLRTFAETLSWSNERVALALFAYRPAPQVRLTRDPNAFFFFLDHLNAEPPFRLQDDTSWDTNIEEGMAWGIKMIDLDEELYGERRSAKAFVVVSDGQDWSGEVEQSLELARSRGVRVYVVGVGTTAGGLIPDLPPQPYQQPPIPIHSTLDRRSLRAIAEAGGGQYFELGTERDEVIALKILSDIQQRAQVFQQEDVFTELYWLFLAAAAGLLCMGTLVLKDRTQLWWQLATGLTIVILLL